MPVISCAWSTFLFGKPQYDDARRNTACPLAYELVVARHNVLKSPTAPSGLHSTTILIPTLHPAPCASPSPPNRCATPCSPTTPVKCSTRRRTHSSPSARRRRRSTRLSRTRIRWICKTSLRSWVRLNGVRLDRRRSGSVGQRCSRTRSFGSMASWHGTWWFAGGVLCRRIHVVSDCRKRTFTGPDDRPYRWDMYFRVVVVSTDCQACDQVLTFFYLAVVPGRRAQNGGRTIPPGVARRRRSRREASSGH